MTAMAVMEKRILKRGESLEVEMIENKVKREGLMGCAIESSGRRGFI